MSNSIKRSELNNLTESVKTAVLAGNPQIIEDLDVDATETQANAGKAIADKPVEQDGYEDAETDEKSGIFANIYVVINGKRFRLTAQALDGDYIEYTDREKTQRNTVRDVVVNTAKAKGVQYLNESIQVEVEFNQKGVSTLDANTIL